MITQNLRYRGASFISDNLDLSLIDDILLLVMNKQYRIACLNYTERRYFAGIPRGAAVFTAVKFAEKLQNFK
ncbi:MAG: hypothetical protein ACTS78_00020 [Arsenophonus sp. NC-WZS1-MAG3]